MIYLHMNGAPSQLDLWDHKPKLHEFFDKDLPPSVRNHQRLSTMTSGQARFPVAPSMFKFTQHGKCGRYINAELLPHTAKVVDDLAVIKTVNPNAINHDPACPFVMPGNELPGFDPFLKRGAAVTLVGTAFAPVVPGAEAGARCPRFAAANSAQAARSDGGGAVLTLAVGVVTVNVA